MKKICFLICIYILFISMLGCQSSIEETVENRTKKIVENTIKIEMGYGFRNYTARITDKEVIKKLEDLFNEAKFYKTSKPKQNSQLQIAFYGKEDITHFFIDQKDNIRLEDDSYVKSEEINFEKLMSIYQEELSKQSKEKLFFSEDKVKNILGEKIKDSLGITLKVPNYGDTLHIIDQEEIKELEDLFSNAEFYKSNKSNYRIKIKINFYGKKGITHLYVDDGDNIILEDGSCVKSKEIEYGKLFSMYMGKKAKYVAGIEVNPSRKETEKISVNIIENSQTVLIGYGYHNALLVITDQKEIKELEDLFNRAKFYKTNNTVKQSLLHITFYGEKGMIRFIIDADDDIRLQNGEHVKSKEISNKKLYDIYIEKIIER